MAIGKKSRKKKTSKKSTQSTKRAQGKRSSGKDDPDRCDWIHNQAKIEDAYAEQIHKSGRVPTATTLAEVTGFSRDTVGKHLKKFDFGRVRRRLGVALNIALGRAIQNATKDKAFFKDIELLFKIANELTDKMELSGRVDFRSYKDKLKGKHDEDDDDFKRARKLAQILISENII